MSSNRIRPSLAFAAWLFPLLCCGNPLQAGLINVSTGLDASNTVLASGGLSDAHWTVSQQAGGSGAAQSVYPNNADWYGGWLANNSTSAWIARNANVANNGPAPYTFTTTFDLSGYTLSTVGLSGGWAIDDVGTLNLNGTQVGSLGSGAWGSLTSFSVGTGSSLFVQGINTLTLTITQDDQFLEGVRLQGIVSGSVVPEPATIVSTSIGSLMLLAGLRRRRRKGLADPSSR